ncbi:MAG: hypothetical protein JNK37_01625 [Verrucomicrobiales bacterium]|nr:hypothetical protein [Verrucomicrobiales bacterium]
MISPRRPAKSPNPRPIHWLSLLFALTALGGCASTEPKSVEERPYFGQDAHFGAGNTFVPKEVRRVEPWWAIF